MTFANKTVLITGAASGIGLATAAHYSSKAALITGACLVSDGGYTI